MNNDNATDFDNDHYDYYSSYDDQAYSLESEHLTQHGLPPQGMTPNQNMAPSAATFQDTLFYEDTVREQAPVNTQAPTYGQVPAVDQTSCNEQVPQNNQGAIVQADTEDRPPQHKNIDTKKENVLKGRKKRKRKTNKQDADLDTLCKLYKEFTEIEPHLITTRHTVLLEQMKALDLSDADLFEEIYNLSPDEYFSIVFDLKTNLPIVTKRAKEEISVYELVGGIRWYKRYKFLLNQQLINKDEKFTVAVIENNRDTDLKKVVRQSLVRDIRDRLHTVSPRTKINKRLNEVLERLETKSDHIDT